jgi:lysozyme
MNESKQYSMSVLQMTAGFESLALVAYQKMINGKLDKWTCGFGHTGDDVYKRVTCDRAQALRWLQEDIQWAERVVRAFVKNVNLTQGEFDALVDFTFNCGSGNLEHSTLLKLVNAGQFEAAAKEFEKWNKCDGKACAGLLRRRLAEEAEFDGKDISHQETT